MHRFMKHLPTNSIHSYEDNWLRVENHGFVECDKDGNLMNAPIEGEATVVVEPKKVTGTRPKAKPKAKTAADAAVDEAIEAAAAALSADASNIK